MKRLIVLVALCGIVMTAQASLVTWNPGDPGTTRQEWLFNSDANPALPDTNQNPYNTAVAWISNTLNPTAFAWYNGMWSGSTFSLTVDVPNNPVSNPYKEVLVEVIYQGDIVLSWVMDGDWNDFEKTYSCDTDLGDGWKKRTDLWRIEPNPSNERICYGFKAPAGGRASLDSVLIDTICIPEPATLVLLGLGIIASRKRR